MISRWTRRKFIGAATLGTSGLAITNLGWGFKPSTEVPEISASVFPWDLADEGMEQVLDNLQEMAGVNSVYLCNLSEEVRPFRGGEYTHNPVRKSYKCEDSHIYWPPDMKYYGKIKPLRTQRDFLAGTDWVGEFIEATRKRGMKSGVEFFHGYIDQSRLENQFSDSIQIN
jgi:hypothetical protein